MSASRGEGRSAAEKAQRIREDPARTKERKARIKQEDLDWAAKCGPVTTRKIEPKENT